MVAVPRTASALDGAQIASPKVATRTVVGMVLGILCLFGMILSYQLLSCPCRRQKAKRPRTPRPYPVITSLDPQKPPRSFRNCFGLFSTTSKPSTRTSKPYPTLNEKGTPSDSGRKGGHKTIRSFYLSLNPFKRNTSPCSGQPQSSTADGTGRGPTLRERRGAIRSLYLNTSAPPRSPRKRYPDSPSPFTPTLKRMGRVFEFDSGPPPDAPSLSPGFFSPWTPHTPLSPRRGRGRRHYAQLDDSAPMYDEWSNEAIYKEKEHRQRPKAKAKAGPNPIAEPPQDALVSPWSPDEGELLYYTPSTAYLTPSPFADACGPKPFGLAEPRTPPPLYPPPPAYLPEVPRRGSGSVPATPTRAQTGRGSAPRSPLSLRKSEPEPMPALERGHGTGVQEVDISTVQSTSDPFASSPIASSLAEIDGELEGWESEFRQIRATLADPGDGAFVIADDSESELSVTLDNASIHTNESMEPLTL